MNKFSLYVLLILLYLGISKSFSPSEKKTIFVPNANAYANIFKGSPISVILERDFSTGALIKTYHHRYQIIHAFKAPQRINVRISREFFLENQANIGMSLFRRYENDVSSTVPMPPGSIYIGSPAYGTWRTSDSGQKVWRFHRTYKNFPQLFHWGDFTPTYEFYRRMIVLEKANSPFYGLNNEFGTKGSVTSTHYVFKKKSENKTTINDILKKYTSLPKWEQKNE
ncbi:hypothetical protein [Bacteriovorax sp. BAL6_X]|uniref:hypothetical protein n=1 Tax=Bacteriovorax sp. BAL6_X TaxID=1201290 RepID=UPI00058FB592|nr:hypothetical protein [Bacteriovorax sp. BAL6_X]